MAAAMKLLKRDGYRRVQLSDIAKDAGVSKATVYYYFTDKDDLLTRAVAGRMGARHADFERRLAAAGGSATHRLRVFLREFWRLSLSPQTALWQRLLVSEIITDAPDVFDAWGRGLIERWRLAESLIVEGQRAGEFRRDVDPDAAARAIVSALSHQALFHVHFGLRRLAPYRANRLFDEMVSQFLHGLREPSRRASR